MYQKVWVWAESVCWTTDSLLLFVVERGGERAAATTTTTKGGEILINYDNQKQCPTILSTVET